MTALKAVIIIGDDLNNSNWEIQDFVNTTPDKSQYFFIGDGKAKVTKDMIADSLRGKEVDSKTKILINFHGGLYGDRHQINDRPTSEMFKHVSDCINEGKANPIPLQFYLGSCYGGAAAKDVEVLPLGSSVIAYGPDDDVSFGDKELLTLLRTASTNPLINVGHNLLESAEQGVGIGIKCIDGGVCGILKPMHDVVLDLKSFEEFLKQRMLAFGQILTDVANHGKLPDNIIIPGPEEIPMKWGKYNLETARKNYFQYQCRKASDGFVDFLEKNKGDKSIKSVIRESSDILGNSLFGSLNVKNRVRVLRVLLQNGAYVSPGLFDEWRWWWKTKEASPFGAKADLLEVLTEKTLFNQYKAVVLKILSSRGEKEAAALFTKFVNTKNTELVLNSLEVMPLGDIVIPYQDREYIKELVQILFSQNKNTELSKLIKSCKGEVKDILFECNEVNKVNIKNFLHYVLDDDVNAEVVRKILPHVSKNYVNEVLKEGENHMDGYSPWIELQLLNQGFEVCEEAKKTEFFMRMLGGLIEETKNNFFYRNALWYDFISAAKSHDKYSMIDTVIKELEKVKTENPTKQSFVAKNSCDFRNILRLNKIFDEGFYSKGDNPDNSIEKEIEILNKYRSVAKESFVEKERNRKPSPNGRDRI